MQDVFSLEAPTTRRPWKFRALVRASAPTLAECGWAVLSSALLILSFPDFNLWPLAWVGLVPLFVAIARKPRAPQAFLLGWATGTLFFYGSCYWLTYPMIHYGGLPAWVAYPVLFPGALVLGLFPAACGLALARACGRWGARALFLAPFLWAGLEWARLGLTGQLWNAIGYSQAYTPALIQFARTGGVYAVGFLLVTFSAAVAFVILQRSARSLAIAAVVTAAIGLTVLLHQWTAPASTSENAPSALVVALQPNISPDFNRSAVEFASLVERHLVMSERALREIGGPGGDSQPLSKLPRIVVWPESPMNFAYARDAGFRETVRRFTRTNRASLLFNSLEPAPADGGYNAAMMVNEEGRPVAQYDKIRLLPFGEYVPLPGWLPGAGMVQAIVGEFTPGTRYLLMPLGDARAGVFICFESAFPSIARRFTDEGADVLINISNDAYQGRTAVMRQHLANAVFRAVENGRPVLRVTNTGITALISPRGEVIGATESFEPAVRIWTVARATDGKSFYTRRGDLFAVSCAVIGVMAMLVQSLKPKVRSRLSDS